MNASALAVQCAAPFSRFQYRQALFCRGTPPGNNFLKGTETPHADIIVIEATVTYAG